MLRPHRQCLWKIAPVIAEGLQRPAAGHTDDGCPSGGGEGHEAANGGEDRCVRMRAQWGRTGPKVYVCK
jgi:hypothetical protein